MKRLLFILIISALSLCVHAQTGGTASGSAENDASKTAVASASPAAADQAKCADSTVPCSEAKVENTSLKRPGQPALGDDAAKAVTDDSGARFIGNSKRFHWTPAVTQSLVFLGLPHAFRLGQAKTKRELGGNFFGDWAHSVRNLRGWRDSDRTFTNYVAHPMQGAMTGRIFLNNSDASKKLQFGKSQAYWASRFKAMAWAAAWSTQFELGPISEASIGNVGIHDNRGPSKMAWVDMIITPTMGTGLIIGEDAIDRYVLKGWLEKKANYRMNNKIRFFRMVLTPTASFGNLIRLKVPWKRDDR